MSRLIMRLSPAWNRCSTVPGVRIEPARSLSRRGDLGRSLAEHKERIKAERDTSLSHAPPVLTEVGREESWFVY